MRTPNLEPRWLDQEDSETWIVLARLLTWLPAALDNQLQRDSGMSHFEYGILAGLSEAEGGTLRMSDLAAYANGSLSRLSRAVARLERRNWVARSPDPNDGRYTLATLTDAGRTAVVDAAPGHVEAVNHLVFDALTGTQTRQLRAIAARVLKAVESEADSLFPPHR